MTLAITTPAMAVSDSAANLSDSSLDEAPKVKISHTGLPVFGIPGYEFDLIHITAIVSLGISILVSGTVVAYLHWDGVAVWRKSIGERLTIYLAMCDLFYSISHMLDHAYMEAVRDHPPVPICVAFSFFLSSFILAQSLLVSFTAVNAFLLVVKEVKVSLGRYDWRLLAGAFGVPAAAMAPCAALGLIGPSGAWCFVDMRKSTGPLVTTILSSGLIATFLANLLCYLAVWGKIQQVTKATAAIGSSTSQQAKYAGTARILMLFVAAYMVQWWPYVIYSIWANVQNPPIALLVITVLLCNMGGVFNFVAYTFVRVLMKQKAAEEKAGAKLAKSEADSKATSTSNVSGSAS